MTGKPEHNELGVFLRNRRAQLTPHEVGIIDRGEVRKVKGLRREEVAQLASISVDYYTRLEQGRVRASTAVLVTLVRALRLDDDQQTYLYAIAGKVAARTRRRASIERPRPAARRLLEQLEHTPAVIFGKRLDILQWNRAAEALYLDFGVLPVPQRNYVRLIFTNPHFRALHLDWEHDAREVVAALRMKAAEDPDDPELIQLVGELSVQDPDFRTWWAERHVNSATSGTKRYRHQSAGELSLDCDTWDSPDASGQRLMVISADIGSPAHHALQVLTSGGGRPEIVGVPLSQ